MARDRVGICPLFWSRQGDLVYFASEIKALIASGAVKPAADPRGLDHLFTFFALGTRRTAFAGVEAIAPGHYVKIALGSDGRTAEPVEQKYWDFDFPDWGEEEDPTDAAAIDAFEEAFAARRRDQAPRRRAGGGLSLGRGGFGLCARHRRARLRPRAALLHHSRAASGPRREGRGGGSGRGDRLPPDRGRGRRTTSSPTPMPGSSPRRRAPCSTRPARRCSRCRAKCAGRATKWC